MARDRRERDDEFDDDRPARRRERDEFDEDPGYSRLRPATKGVNVCGVIALVMGLVGLLISLFPCIGWLVGLPVAAIGLVLGLIGLFTSRKTTGRGLPIAGTCVSLAGVLIGGAWAAYLTVKVNDGLTQTKERLEVIRQDVEKAQRAAEEQSRLAEERRKVEEKELREGKAVSVTAEKLFADYDTNPLSADSKYKNKLLEVTGTIRRVDRDRFGRLAVELETVDKNGGLVRCEFPREAQNQLDRLTAKQKVVIRGKCEGVGKQAQVKLDNCLLVSKEAPL